jgi:pimeloyl-ACP methyl ester carboxylesterase
MYFDVMTKIGTWGQVLAPDTPGYGQSTPLTSAATLSDYAAELIQGIRAWSNGEKVVVGGIHTGASLSVEIANQAPDLCKGLFLIGLPTYTEEMRASRIKDYAPSIEIKEDGSHVMWAWERYRAMWPTAPLSHIQLATSDLIYNLERYNWAYLQAFKYAVAERIKNVKCALRISAAEKEFLFAGSKKLAEQIKAEFTVFEGLDGQVPLRAPDKFSAELKKFYESTIGSSK